jgi:hypothetical protein
MRRSVRSWAAGIFVGGEGPAAVAARASKIHLALLGQPVVVMVEVVIEGATV